MPSTYLFTSESVSEGHPDKVADRVSDEILDALLSGDPQSRVAVETLVTTNLCVVAGEVTSLHASSVDYGQVAREAIRAIGYGDPRFDADTVQVEVHVHEQSPEIGMGVDKEGAGDQGLMFGYACRDTDTLMPAAIHYSHRIVQRLAALRHGGLKQLGPDAKSQVTVEYADGRPQRAHTVVVSQMHSAELDQDDVRRIVEPVLREVLPTGWVDDRTRVLVNPTGKFSQGGPATDTGLTGRKIIVDTYGGAAPHGGGAFSGKDASKVDRSAAYAARWLAKNVVAAGLADRCTIQVAYAIGVPEPLALYVDCHDTGRRSNDEIAALIQKNVDLRPRAIRERLGLDRPIYARTAAYGHFGRAPEADGGFSWEATDLAKEFA